MARRLAVGASAAALSVSLGCNAIKRSMISSQFDSAIAALEPSPDAELTQYAPDLYSYRWGVWRSLFLTTDEGVIVMDPINPTAAAGLASAIERVAPHASVRYVLYSHGHRDHVGGAARLGNATVVAHADAAKDIAEHPNPDVLAPTETFGGATHDVTLGGRTVTMVTLPESHGRGLVAFQIPHRSTVMAVDICFPRSVPPFGMPLAQFYGVENALRALSKLSFDWFVSGHTMPGPKTRATRAEFDAQLRFLSDLDDSMHRALAARHMSPLSDPAALRHGMGDVLFDVEDQLRPRYGRLPGFDEMIFPAAQWAFFGMITNE